MAWLVIAFSLLISAPALAGAAPVTSMTMSPDDRAKQWMTLIDDQNYADAYQQMGAAARGKIASDAWTQKMHGARDPLGAVSSRTLKDVKMTKTLPGLRDGQYATVRYDSAFAHKAAGVETVNLVLENGAWSVIGYFIN
ncbi:MAG: DUF4019 domain-containing protein [Alphaproteobacteria bacterium]|nr:DUF4019 domain-containing protein [Alphaproteobacteria bacterium]